MNTLRRFLIRLTAIGNITAALLLLICGLSPWLNPTQHPWASVLGLCFPIMLALNAAFLIIWLIIRPRYLWLTLLGLLPSITFIHTYCPINLPADKPQHAIKLLTYNTRTLDAKETNAAGLTLTNYIAQSGADIICLQECSSKHAQQFDSVMTAHGYHIARCDKPHSIAVYTLLPIISQHLVTYQSLTNGSWAVELLYQGDTILLINNHLESYKLTPDDKAKYRDMIKEPESEKAEAAARTIVGKISEASCIRAPQVDSVINYIRSSTRTSIIVCGDFNESPISYSCLRMSERLKSAYKQSGNGPGFTYNEKGFYFRIDHIFVSPDWHTYNTYIDKSAPWSDHYPLISYIEKEKVKAEMK